MLSVALTQNIPQSPIVNQKRGGNHQSRCLTPYNQPYGGIDCDGNGHNNIIKINKSTKQQKVCMKCWNCSRQLYPNSNNKMSNFCNKGKII